MANIKPSTRHFLAATVAIAITAAALFALIQDAAMPHGAPASPSKPSKPTDEHALAVASLVGRTEPADNGGIGVGGAGAVRPSSTDPIEAFEHAQACAKTARLKAALPSLVYNVTDPQARAELDPEDLDAIEKNLTFVEEHESDCGNTPTPTAMGFQEIALRAARSGSKEAAICYVEAPFTSDDDMRRKPLAFQAYRTNAVEMLEAGIRAGDWTAVHLGTMRYGSSYIDGEGWLRALSPFDDQMVYMFYRIQWLGAADASIADKVAETLDAYRDSLTPGQVAEADRQARRIYEAHFAGAGKYAGQEDICDL